MGQSVARVQLEDGLRKYKAGNYEGAIRKWKSVLSKVRNNSNGQFTVLGYLVCAFFECGNYREMLKCAIQQFDIADKLDVSEMKAEAYLNLARSNECLCEYHKAISYARHSLSITVTQKEGKVSIKAQTHLCLAASYLGFGDFQSSVSNAKLALELAKKSEEKTLECNVYSVFGDIFACLKDYEQSLSYYVQAHELVRRYGQNWSHKIQMWTLLDLAVPYRKLVRLNQAMDACEEALKMSVKFNERLVQARCLCILADIHRTKKDFEACYPRYESALGFAIEASDRHAQIQIISGMAKALLLVKKTREMFMLRSHWILMQLDQQLNDPTSAHEHAVEFDKCIDDMELRCAVCQSVMGDKLNVLKILACSHVCHASCVQKADIRNGHPCPNCRRPHYDSDQIFV
ncbi:43 kDa receptor-associated protein of the synapse-like [Anneissia japonica]|uniref:43 kDa receptor-associated protein of the synapse-like n=1 Tax=Anneissia japonica TaxID=1529436 RepID=UPI0014256D38|nr:43 kDa receptor-associated protein of the synapse-like [Anneissia japonica]